MSSETTGTETGFSSDEQPYQVMPELEDEQYQRLKDDIEKHGIEYPIIVDADGNIIDGHHRMQACEELGIDPPKRVVDATEAENYHRAYRANLLQRELANGTKRKVVKQYLLEHPERLEDDTQDDIASDLGVSQQTVSNSVKELDASGKLTNLSKISTAEKKQEVRTYIDHHPQASNREVALNLDFDISHATVGNWRNKWGETQEETTNVDTFVKDSEQEETVREITNEAKSGDETAAKQAEKLSEFETTPEYASRDIEREKTAQRNEERAENAPDIPDGEYAVILADPPWQYDHQKTPNRNIENHYGTLSEREIKDLEIPAADDAVLYLWTTAPKLESGLEVLSAWGFEYVTNGVWDKQKIGMGYWFRGQHEIILVGKRGGISPPDPDSRRSSVINVERTEHSRKPDEVHELIEAGFPDLPKLELFAREAREGWDTWGDEV